MRIHEKFKKNYPLAARLIFWAQEKKYGEALLPAKIWGHSPKLLYGLQILYRALDRRSSPIPIELRVLLNAQVSRLNHCAFCLDISEALMKKNGIAKEKLFDLEKFSTSHLFSPKEKSALAYAQAVSSEGCKVSNAIFAELSQHFNPDQVVELTALISYQNMTSRFNAALEIPAQGFCRKPE